MVLYTCPRCEYFSSKLNNMERHFNRKKLCAVIHADISKEECIKSYLNKDSCKIVKKPNDKVVKKPNDKIVNINNINIVNNVNNVYNIIINPFGKESIDHINAQDICNLVLKRPNNAINTVVEMIYKEPCNKNIKLPGLNSGQMTVLNNNNEWVCLSKNDALYKMGTNGLLTINTKCNEKNLDLCDTPYNKISEEYQEENKHTMKRIINNINNYVKTEYIQNRDNKK
jgi:hypothetical protein